MNATIAKEVEALSRIASYPSLQALSYALRHPETWPADFVWDYSYCETCAIGLSLRLWPQLQLPEKQEVQETWIAREMAMSYRDARDVFFGMAPSRVVVKKIGWFRREEEIKHDFHLVTPDDVADAIDRCLARA